MWRKKQEPSDAGHLVVVEEPSPPAQKTMGDIPRPHANESLGGPPKPPAEGRRKPIGEVLIERGVLTPEQLAQAIVAQAGSGRLLGQILVDLDLVNERDIARALADQFGLELANLAQEAPDPEVAMLLPEMTARRLHAIPVRRDGHGGIIVATSDPRPGTTEEIAQALGVPVTLQLASDPEVVWALNASHKALAGIDEHVSEFTSVYGTDSLRTQTAVIDTISDDAPVVTIVNRIIVQALRDRASDVHIEPQSESIRVRFRIDGVLHEIIELPPSMGAPMASRVKIMSDLNIVERRRPQDGQIRMEFDGRKVDIRVSTTGVVWGEKIVLRLLDKQGPVIELKDLGMDDSTRSNFLKDLHSPYGMVVCAGPTGSGKTTTLYSGLMQINTPQVNITTIEDPVEYVFPSLNQIPISAASGMSFASGLRSILRQDPDVILVGEMRDVETARIGIQAALTGHLVLSSVHATDAVSTVYRFMDMGIERFALASSLLSVIGQRLVRRVCHDCKVPYTPTIDELAFFTRAGGDPLADFVHGQGCNYCAQTGYRGRIGVYEMLHVNEQIRVAIIDEQSTGEDIERIAKGSGMVTLKEQGVRLVTEQETTVSEIIRSIYTI